MVADPVRAHRGGLFVDAANERQIAIRLSSRGIARAVFVCASGVVCCVPAVDLHDAAEADSSVVLPDGADARLAEDSAHPHDVGRDANTPDGTPPPDDVLRVPIPPTLNATGLYADIATRQLAPGIITYRPRYELWNDGAAKQRFLFLPPGTRIDTREMDHWQFPVGTRLWMESRVGTTLVETRYLEHYGPQRADWLRVGYAWNTGGTDAVAMPDGVNDVLGTGYRIAPEGECGACHGPVRGGVIGLSAVQLTSDGAPSQLSDFAARNLLSDPPLREPIVPGAGVVRDSLGYLHTNCGNCHSGEPGTESTTRITLRLFVSDRVPTDTSAYATAIGSSSFHTVGGTSLNVVPGAPEQSQLWVRMGLRDLEAMPPIGSSMADTAARETIRQWIAALPP